MPCPYWMSWLAHTTKAGCRIRGGGCLTALGPTGARHRHARITASALDGRTTTHRRYKSFCSCTYTQNMITPDTMLDTSIPPTSKLQTDPKTRAPHTPKAQIRFSVRCSNLSAAGIHPGAGFRSAGKDQLASLSRRPSQAGTKPIASSWWGRSPPLGTTLSRAEQMPQPWVRFGVRPQP